MFGAVLTLGRLVVLRLDVSRGRVAAGRVARGRSAGREGAGRRITVYVNKQFDVVKVEQGR